MMTNFLSVAFLSIKNVWAHGARLGCDYPLKFDKVTFPRAPFVRLPEANYPTDTEFLASLYAR